MLFWLMVGLLFYVQSQTITIKDSETAEPLEMVSLISNSLPKAFISTMVKLQANIDALKMQN